MTVATTKIVSDQDQGQGDAQVVAVLLTKKAKLGSLIFDLEDQISHRRCELATISETLKVFGIVEPEQPKRVPNGMLRKNRKGFRRGELARRVLDKIR